MNRIYILRMVVDSYEPCYDNIRAFSSKEEAHRICEAANKESKRLKEAIANRQPKTEEERSRLIMENPFKAEYGFGMDELYCAGFDVEEIDLV